MNQQIKGVLFDLDGTLIDSHDLILASFRYAIGEVLGKDFSDEVYMAKVGQPLATQMWDFTDDEDVHTELLRVYREHNARVHDSMVSVFPHVSDVLSELRAHQVSLGVVTSKIEKIARCGLRACGIEDFFAFVVSPSNFPEHKPAPGPVLHGAELLGLAPSECLYVGDSPYDLQSGKGAGSLTAAALWGMFSKDSLLAEKPDFVCESMLDVATAVLG